MSKTRRVLTTEFKHECVNLVLNQGYTISQAASAMQVGLSSMQLWIQPVRMLSLLMTQHISMAGKNNGQS